MSNVSIIENHLFPSLLFSQPMGGRFCRIPDAVQLFGYKKKVKRSVVRVLGCFLVVVSFVLSQRCV